MNWISFDPLRTLGMAGLTYIKPEHMYRRLAEIARAEVLLFPAYWQLNSLHYALGRRTFPSSATYHLGHTKIEMTRALLSVCPDNVPHTWIGASTPAQLEEAVLAFDLPLVAKDVRSARGEGVYLIETRAQLADHAARNQVLYLQEYLPIDRDMRIVYVGDRVVSGYWRQASAGAFHNNVARGGRVLFEAVPEVACELVADVARRLGVDHAGFDVAEVHGRFYILEFNPLFGLEALNHQGIRLAPLISDYLQRTGPSPGEDPDAPVAA